MTVRKHRPFTPAQYERGSTVGRTNGYAGEKGGGGWIISSDGVQVCHGWGQFYHHMPRLKLLNKVSSDAQRN